MEQYNDINHSGVLGMRWGHRKDRPNGVTTGQKPKKKSKAELRRDEMAKLSDTELRQRINRLQMEKQYDQLTSPQTGRGKKVVKDVLANAAKQTATNYASKYMTKGMDALIEGVGKSTSDGKLAKFATNHINKGVDKDIAGAFMKF